MAELVIKLKKSRLLLRFIFKPLLFLFLAAAGIDLIWGIIEEDLGSDPHETLLHTTGLWALNSLMVTLAVSPVSKWLAWPLFMTVRRMCGLMVFFYATAHIWVFIQYIADFDWSLITSEIIKRPYITIGFIAWLLLIPLAVTSTKGMMKKLGKRWKKLHKLVYIIGILAVWHFTWQVKLDLNKPIFYLLILVILLGWRDLQSKRRRSSKNTYQ